ncbi:MAG: RNA polymerase sigma factor [Cyclobacteriaceae bacterium]|nr:RNA polymerase sigma factor [Cyclobacteriaceae bacterium HetDA_MAG_MS6]
MQKAEQDNLFLNWINGYKNLIFKFVRAYAFELEDQDDLFQEICIQLWRSIPGYRGESAVSTWIYRVTLNTSVAWTRKEKKYREGKAPLLEAHTIQKASDQDDRLDWLYKQVIEMDKIDRALTLLLLDGFSYKEMSSMLGISESNVGVKISRIKKKLIEKSKEIISDEV